MSEKGPEEFWGREEELRRMLREVINNADMNANGLNAKAYAGAALNNPYGGGIMKGHELEVQLLYLRGNMSGIKGDVGKKLRTKVDAWIKALRTGKEPQYWD